MSMIRYIILIFVLTVFALQAQYESQENMPGLNPDHSEKLYDELLENQGVKPPPPQPGTESDEDPELYEDPVDIPN